MQTAPMPWEGIVVIMNTEPDELGANRLFGALDWYHRARAPVGVGKGDLIQLRGLVDVERRVEG